MLCECVSAFVNQLTTYGPLSLGQFLLQELWERRSQRLETDTIAVRTLCSFSKAVMTNDHTLSVLQLQILILL